MNTKNTIDIDTKYTIGKKPRLTCDIDTKYVKDLNTKDTIDIHKK